MSEPTHVIVTLSPESIDALAAAAVKAFLQSEEGAYRPRYRRPPYALKPERLPGYEAQGSGQTEAVRAAIAGLSSVTIPQLCGVLGIPPERQTRAMAMAIGAELRECGWVKSGQRTSGARRDRVYKPAPPVVG